MAACGAGPGRAGAQPAATLSAAQQPHIAALMQVRDLLSQVASYAYLDRHAHHHLCSIFVGGGSAALSAWQPGRSSLLRNPKSQASASVCGAYLYFGGYQVGVLSWPVSAVYK